MPKGTSLIPRLRVTPARRLVFFIAVDTLLIALAVIAAFALRFDGLVPREYFAQMAFITAIATVATVGTLVHFHVYRISWRHVGLRDIAVIAIGIVFSTFLLAAAAQMLYWRVPTQAFPRSIVFIWAPLAFLALSAFRISKRVYISFLTGSRAPLTGEQRPTLLVGAGDAGRQVLRSIMETPIRHRNPVVGFIDDDPLAHGTIIDGVVVLGPVQGIGRHIQANGVKTVVICVSGATSQFVRMVVDACHENGVDRIRIIPPVSQLVDGKVTFEATRQVSLEDLLGRKKIKIRNQDLSGLIQGKRVLVTGGAGTIGAEIARQVAQNNPERLVILDIDETRLHDTALDLKQTQQGLDIAPALVDVRDQLELQKVFQDLRPQLVLHAAAYKHVPMMQEYPLTALQVNVIGTHNVAQAAEDHGCERFVLISTDKAVEPVNVMGASKRLAEMVVLGRNGDTRMIRSAVRFGNVIGSRGSVIPIFERQIARGGPLTVTHPEIERYFMITSEAVSLVLQAAAIGRGGDLFVLDMGKPVRILDVAKEFIRLKGLEGDVDIPIVFSGLRPGERLFEALYYEQEAVEPTNHPSVMRAIDGAPRMELSELLEEVQATIDTRDPQAVTGLLSKRFPSFKAHLEAPVPLPTKHTERD
jgi:FlaA1/EpsC-like NDP-sugar epimerase